MLGSNQANIKAVITADDRASKVLRNFGNETNKLGQKASKFGTLAKASMVGAGAAAIKFGVDSVKAFSEAQDVMVQTNAVLKSTKGVAGVTADQVRELAKAWQSQSKYSDESVQSAENILLTFTSINAKVFPQTLEAVLNISTALGQDLKTSSIQVGKALQDPIRGVTALRRVGVNFSQSQIDLIKKLVDTGQAAKAQALILKELQTEFGGSAKAAGQTLSGSLERLKNRFNDLQETVGGFLAKGVGGLANWLAGNKQGTDALSAANQNLGGTYDFLKLFVDGNTRAHDRLKKAQDGVKQSQDNLKQANANLAKLQASNKTSTDQLWKAMQRQFGAATDLDIAFNRLKRRLRESTDALNALREAQNVFKKGAPGLLITLKRIELQYGRLGSSIQLAADASRLLLAPNPQGGTLPGALQGTTKKGVPGVKQARASGGPVRAGQPYTVGEEGVELFVPRQSGSIIPNNKLSGTVNFIVNIGMYAGSEIEKRKIAKELHGAYVDAMAAKGMA